MVWTAAIGVLFEHHLGEPLAIAQVDEDGAAVVAAIGDPAEQDHLGADVLGGERAAGVGPLQLSDELGQGRPRCRGRVRYHDSPERERAAARPGDEARRFRLAPARGGQGPLTLAANSSSGAAVSSAPEWAGMSSFTSSFSLEMIEARRLSDCRFCSWLSLGA